MAPLNYRHIYKKNEFSLFVRACGVHTRHCIMFGRAVNIIHLARTVSFTYLHEKFLKYLLYY